VAIESEQETLTDLINDYRKENNLPAIPTSYWLTVTAMFHTVDRSLNGQPANCDSGHSWSSDSKLWKGCCYSSAQWQCMSYKPSEISKGGYNGTGYENWVQASSAQQALDAWKNSPAHNQVILNLEGWSGYSWKALGVGTCGGYYSLWVSDTADSNGASTLTTLTCGNMKLDQQPLPDGTVVNTGGTEESSASSTLKPFWFF